MTSILRRIVPMFVILLFLAGSTTSCIVVKKRDRSTRAVHKKGKHRHRHCHVRGNGRKKVCHSHPHRHPHH